MKRDMIYHSDKNTSELQKDLRKLEAIADTLYETGCEPQDIIIFSMRLCLQRMKETCSLMCAENKFNEEIKDESSNQRTTKENEASSRYSTI